LASLALAAAAGGCALVGYDFDGYAPESTGGGGSLMTTGTGGASETDCTNGVDEDGDDTVDCADPDCLGHLACSAPLPSGWTGPVALKLSDDANVTCASPFDVIGPSGSALPSGAPVTCGGCSCGHEPCDSLKLALSQDGACSTTAPNLFVAYKTACAGLSPTAAASVLVQLLPTLQNVTCAPSGGGVLTKSPAVFNKHVLLCAPSPSSGGCDGGTCLPKPPAGFDPRICIYRAGSLECPASYSKAIEFGSTIADGRTCTPCACGAPAATCPASLAFYGDNACASSFLGKAANTGVCVVLGGASVTVSAINVAAQSPCAPVQAAPTGGVTIADPITVCCQ
jgi:hypothetical protein